MFKYLIYLKLLHLLFGSLPGYIINEMIGMKDWNHLKYSIQKKKTLFDLSTGHITCLCVIP